MVGEGAKMAALILYLAPSASIIGWLTGTNGGDAANIVFKAYRRRTVNGHDRWLPAGAATTNGDGIFRIDEMAAPAAYVLFSRATPEHLGMQVQRSEIVGYLQGCYPANPGDGDVNLLNLAVKLRNSVLQRNDVISDFAQVFRVAINNSPSFGSQQFAQCGLRAFDPARQDCFTASEGANENVRGRGGVCFLQQVSR